MDPKTIIVCVIPIVLASTGTSVDPPELFGKAEKLDKLIIKNQIAYHFKKVVREVKQELFVSRRIDVSLLFAGIEALKQTENEVRGLCNRLPANGLVMSMTPQVVTDVPILSTTKAPAKPEPFVLIDKPHYSSFKEAKARCIALGMQLPEIYQNSQADLLMEFLKKNNIAQIFAGIEPDMTDSIPRHISTQYPIWATAFTKFQECGGRVIDLGWSLDDGHAKFLYTSERLVCVTLDTEGNPFHHKLYGSHTFREIHKTFSQMHARIVCSPKWDGKTDLDLPTENFNKGGMKIKTRYTRSTKVNRLRRSGSQPIQSSMKNVRNLCHGVADQAKESYEDMQSKMTDLLALVDITAHGEITGGKRQRRHRQKRIVPLFVMKFIFVSGVKLLWQLFGFVQKVQMNKRMKNIESILQATSNRSIQNSEAITNMTKLIAGNSYAINQLNIRVDGLEQRLELVEIQLRTVKDGVDGLTYKFEIVTALVTIDNLVVRTKRSMDTGYDILKDIIHNSNQRQTSPLVLPLDQIEFVQSKISVESTAVLDPDFAKMQSIVVSDPLDPTKLLVVINMAALGRKNLELVHMVPVPYFEDNNAYAITLDYDHIVLDQSSQAFSILTKQEEYDCLFSRCYIGSTEQSFLERSCGIPQFYDRHKDGCVSEVVTSNGVYLKPMLPDGVIFALKGEVRSEVFCKDEPSGPPRQLRGTGILQLPNGCILRVIDEYGKVYKVKGLPQYTLVNAGKINLVPDGPLNAINTDIDTNDTRKVATVNSYVESRVQSVIRQVEHVDSQVAEQHKHVWILTGTISFAIVLIVLTILLLYRYSTRARRKIRDIRSNFSEFTRKVFDPELDDPPVKVGSDNVETRGPPTSPRWRRREAWLRHLRERKDKARASLDEEAPIPNLADRSYICMSELEKEDEESRYLARPLSRASAFRPIQGLDGYPREYPRITPLMREAKFKEFERLEEETELIEQLCKSRSPKVERRSPISPNNHPK